MTEKQAKYLKLLVELLVFMAAWTVIGSYIDQNVGDKATAMQFFGGVMYILGRAN